jgi:hypothetical protein
MTFRFELQERVEADEGVARDLLPPLDRFKQEGLLKAVPQLGKNFERGEWNIHPPDTVR